MNSKLCKRLRKMAYQMSFDPKTKESMPMRRLVVHPAQEARAKAGAGMGSVTAINDMRSWRGVYRWLKRNHMHAT